MASNDGGTRREWRGFIIIASLLLSAAVVFNARGILDLLRPTLELVAVLPAAPGVRVGTTVWVAGVESGRVTAIEFLPSGRPLPGGDTAEIALRLRLHGESQNVLRQDSRVESTRRRFIGEPLIQLSVGSTAAPPVENGDTLFALPPTDPVAVLEQTAAFPATIDSLLDAFREVARVAERREPELARLQDRIAAATEAAARLTRDLDGGSLGPLLGDTTLVVRITALQRRVGEVAAAAGAALERYVGSAEAGSPLAGSLEELSRRSLRIRSELERLRSSLEEGRGLLGRLERDSALVVAIREVRLQVDSLAAEAASIALRMAIP